MQSTTLAQPRQYGAAQARFIMKLADECAGGFNFLEFRDTAEVPGVFMSEPYADVFPSGARGIEAGRLLAWNPAIDLENGPDPATWPLLPAEFTARDLAAFLLYGVGTFIHDALGPYGVLDEAALENVGGSRDEWARKALREAYELAGRAQAVVGPLDDEAERKARLIGQQLDMAVDQANERERVFEPGIPGDEANARRDRAKASVARLEKEFEELASEATQKRERWRKAMVRALLEGQEVDKCAVEVTAEGWARDPGHEQTVAAPVDTVLPKREILSRLRSRFPELENAWKRNEEWIRGACVRHGRYRLEVIEAGCRKAWPKEATSRSEDRLSAVGQLRAMR